MISKGLRGVDFAVVDTDASSLISARTRNRVQLSVETTASGPPEINPKSIEEIRGVIDGVNLLFITAGMGRGTGPWAAPAIGNMAREMGILTIGAVGLPFVREDTGLIIPSGSRILDLRLTVDALFVHPLQSRDQWSAWLLRYGFLACRRGGLLERALHLRPDGRTRADRSGFR